MRNPERLASFDIFDTALIRTCGNPENIFYLLACSLYPEQSDTDTMRNSFFLWRMGAESRAVKRLSKNSVTLEEIYREFDRLSFPGLEPGEVMLMEKRLESACLVASSSVRSMIDARRREGYRIIFISDMYLDSRFLKDVLVREGCAQEDDDVFVSCEMGATKYSGELFDKVHDICGPLSFWMHYGDNPVSDIRRPSKRGIKTVHIAAEYTGPERYFLSVAGSYPYWHDCSVLAGFQRAARLSSEPVQADPVDLIAPVYIPYVLYILRKAMETGIHRLYFLSRDGYILKEIAEVFTQAYPDIEVRYLYVSRRSLFLPGLFTLEREEFYENLGYDADAVYPLAYRRMKISTLKHFLKVSGDGLGDKFDKLVNFSEITSRDEEDRFFEALKLPEVKDRILSAAAQEREYLVRYFRQEGLMDGIPFSTVDVGWTGSSRLIINRILASQGFPQHVGFYLGCSGRLVPPKYGLCHCYYGNHLDESCPAGLFEHYFSSAVHSSVFGYAEKNDTVVPLFEREMSEQARDSAVARVEAVKKVAEYVSEHISCIDPEAMKFWGSMYLDIYSNIRCDVDYSFLTGLEPFHDADDVYSLVRRISLKELIRYWRKGNIRGVIFPRMSIFHTFGLRIGYRKYSQLKMRFLLFRTALGSTLARLRHKLSGKF